jgi:hypothetical protein
VAEAVGVVEIAGIAVTIGVVGIVQLLGTACVVWLLGRVCLTEVVLIDWIVQVAGTQGIMV